jgi:hypothetical protein
MQISFAVNLAGPLDTLVVSEHMWWRWASDPNLRESDAETLLIEAP